MKREDTVHRAAEDRVDLIFLGRDRETHAQEVGRIIQIIARIHEGLADCVLVGHGGNCGHLGDQADRGHFALVRIIDVGTVVIERGHGTHDADHDRHRMSIAPEAPEEVHHLLVQHRVVGHTGFEIFEHRRCGQFTVKQQIADFEVV